MIRHVKSALWHRFTVVLLSALWAAFAVGCEDSAPKLSANPNRKDGTAVYLLLDVSGSMSESVPNASGAMESKLAIAKPEP